MFLFVINVLLSIFVIIILLSFSITLIIYKVTFNYWKKRNVYTCKPTIPFGNAKDTVLQKIQFGSDINDFYNELKIKSLKYGGYYLCLTPIFVPADMELIKKIFVNDFEHFCDRIAYVDQENDPLSANLVHLSGCRWKLIRAVIRPFISLKHLNEAYPLMKQYIGTLVLLIEETMKREGSVDIKDVLDRYNIDLIGAYFFKTNCNTLKNSDHTIKKKITHFFNTSFKDTLIRMIISVPAVTKFCKIKTYRSEVTTFFSQFVEGVLKNKKNQKSEDLLNVLSTNSIPLTKSEIIGNTAILFLAGYDSTSNTTTFFLYELALNTKLQNDVRNEIKTVLKKRKEEFTNSALDELVLLEKCIKETLRKYPVSIITTRMCTKDYPVPDSDLVLRKGTHVYMPIRGIHWDPEFYPNPEVFDPERFAEENSSRPSCTWIPFGFGPRHCIGQKLANASMKLSLATLLANYEFLLHPTMKCPIRYDPTAFLLKPDVPLKLIVKKV